MSQVSSAFVAEPQLLMALERRAKPVALNGNRILFREGEVPHGVYVVRKGKAALTSKSNEDGVPGFLAGTGSLLGLPAVIGSKAYSLTAEALEGAELSLVSSEDFVELMQTEPQLSFQVLRVLAEEVRFARQSLLPA